MQQLLRFTEADMEDQAQNLIEAASALVEIAIAPAAFSSELLIWLYRKRGTARRTLKDYLRALQDFDDAIALYTMFAPSYDSRGLVYYYL